MYLKTLTMRGFKSFASATTLRLEPGITCVVGPNGSGKSNIVDALSWVMGEQGAKSLRGGKMEDVVFAGTSTRAPLGRAEVSLTIDNSDGALPIDYAEVTISRLMFRSGQSEYAINGDGCRLLDVQDLLSDSGLGREMHVIVGQGQLDQILHAGPEARRAIIEEAAGVLKHRKRKEKALRKLDAMQANLTRLVDLTAELNRRLKPLGRQAEVARKANVIQAELRDARLRLLADDYVTLRDKLTREEADEAAINARRTQLEADLAAARQQEEELDRAASEQAAELARAQQTWFALSSLTERMRAVASLAAERSRLLSADPEPERPGRDPDELERQAAELREEEAGLAERMAEGRAVLSEAIAERSAAEAALASAERRIADEARAAAGRAERLARLRGMADAAASRAAATAEEIERLTIAAEQARGRAEKARQEYSAVQDLADGQTDDRSGLAAEYEQAAATHKLCAERTSATRKAERSANSEVSALQARVEALEETLRRGADATAAVLASPEKFSGVLGPFAGQLTVKDGYETAIGAALGAAAEAVTVGGLDAAVSVLANIRAADAGTVGLVIAGEAGAEAPPRAPLAEGARWAADLVLAPAELDGAVRALLTGVVVVADLDAAAAVVGDRAAHDSGIRCAVTLAGDLLSAHWAHGGSARPQSLLDVRAAVDEAAAQLAAAIERAEQAAEALAVAIEAQEAAQATVDEIRRQMQAGDAAAAEVSGRLGRLAGAARAATDEASRVDAAVGAARRSAEKDLAKLAQLKAELAAAEAEAERVSDPDLAGEQAAEERAELSQRATSARNSEMEARLEVRTVEERLRAIGGRADTLSRSAAQERKVREEAATRRKRRAAQAGVARAVAIGAGVAVSHAEASLAAALARREAAEQLSATGTGVLKSVRSRVAAVTSELDKVVNTAHGTEIARAEHRLRLEQMEQHAVEEFGVEPAVLVAEYGPDVLIGMVSDRAGDERSIPAVDSPEPGSLAEALRAVTDAARADSNGSASPRRPRKADEEPTPVRYVREEQEKRAAEAERQLARLGKVNPLALEEFAALQERHQFLATQLEDLRKTRRDLLTVVKEVDDRVQEVFASAFADTAREFEGLFGRLFPGGSGRLMLTEPDDMLTTGIEIEARPPGKKVKRLSLLSGGERSLTAIAYLFAIFKARPSPFYVLDEVEAALDDTNLQRLLRVFEELRETSQLIVITHQRRTMEAADALYGVSMRGDGVSTVISQRVRESVLALFPKGAWPPFEPRTLGARAPVAATSASRRTWATTQLLLWDSVRTYADAPARADATTEVLSQSRQRNRAVATACQARTSRRGARCGGGLAHCRVGRCGKLEADVRSAAALLRVLGDCKRMEYIILIIVLAVLLLGGLGSTLFVRGRSSRGLRQGGTGTIEAPERTEVPPTTDASATGEQGAGTVAPPRPVPSQPPAPPGPAAPPKPAIEKPPPSAGRMMRLRARLARSQSGFGSALLSLLSRDRLDDDTWDEIEEVLITADVGVGPARQIVSDLRTKVKVEGTRTPDEVKQMLRGELLSQVETPASRAVRTHRHEGHPAIVMMVGVNGTGKTTTCGKLARSLVGDGQTVLLGAADTFRAAAADQLTTWGQRVGAETVRSDKEGADPASVAFEAVSKGIESEVDVVLIDTAGRLHTKTGLMDELGKVKRVIEKKASVDEVLLVLDATTGQNGLRQARVFAEVVDVSGIVLTKLDGTAKGGIVIAVQQELGVPVKLVGLGEGPDDLAPFDPETFVDAIIG